MTLIFKEDLAETDYGGTTKTVTTKKDIKAIVDPVTDPKPWGQVGFMGDSYLHMMVWEGFPVKLVDQFYKTDQYDMIYVKIDELYYRVQELKSPESWDSQIPFWHLLLQKVESAPS